MPEERRIATIVFADVTGSTALGERLDPEDVRALLRRYYDIAREVVVEHGGTIQKFIGDAVVAIFGLPQAHGDDARRALIAALALRDRVRADPRLGDRLPIRLGINTGEIVAWQEDASEDLLITGDAVNVAARLEQAADTWSILCGERTAQAAGGSFTFGAPIDLDAKGKSMPVRAFTVLAQAVIRPAAATSFMGRKADLGQLELVADRAFSEQRPFLVSIIAPAGIGKTRLLEEFLHRLTTSGRSPTVAIAQCLPYGQRLTYWPLRAVLYRLVGIPEETGAAEVREAIRSWLVPAGDTERIAELLAATVGAGESETTDRSAVFAAWRAAFEFAARTEPLVVAFEDVHWSSDTLLDLFEFVMQPRGPVPLLMIALTRPELLDRRPTWGGGRRNYVALALEPLDEQAMAQLVGELLETTSSDLIQQVVKRAEGNPFYAGELARSIVERIGEGGGPGSMERALARLPDTVQATVLARLDVLPTAERRAIQLGAVFGRAFRAPGISALDPQLGPVTAVLENLALKDLLRPSGPDTYTFRHILIREIAYQTLTRGERGRLHAAAGRWTEAQSAGREDQLSELIAYHFRESAMLSKAEDAGSLDAAEIREKAVRWQIRASQVAAAAAATAEAARHLRGAIELAPESMLPDLYEQLGDISESGDLSAESYRTALRLSREASRPPEQQLRILAGLLQISMRAQGSVATRASEEEMMRLRADAASLAQQVTDERTVVRYMAADAFYPFWLSTNRRATEEESALAERQARRACEVAERLDDANLMSVALDALGGLAQDKGEWAESRSYALRRLAMKDRLDIVEVCDAHSVAVWASVELGDLHQADRISAEGLALIQPGQVPNWALHLLAWRAYGTLLLGRWDETLRAGERARQIWLDSRRPAAGYALRGFMAVLDVARAQRDSGLIERFREVIEEISLAFPVGTHWYALAAYPRADFDRLKQDPIARYTGNRNIGMEYVERAISLCADHAQPVDSRALRLIADFSAGQGYRPLEAQARRSLGLALSDARELEAALAVAVAIDARPVAARIRCDLGLLTGASAQLDQGLRELEVLGDIDQVSRIESRRR